MRILELVQRAAEGLSLAVSSEGEARASSQLQAHWHPYPSPVDGSLVQDPDFTLPTLAGPLRWSLFHDSNSAGVLGAYGWGRRASFPLNLQSSSAIVTVMHEDGLYRQYVSDGFRFTEVGTPNGDTLVRNEDGTWDETRGDNGHRYHYPAGNIVSLAYKVTPVGLYLTYSYDGQQRLQNVQEPAGRLVSLGYVGTTTTVIYVQDWGDRRNTFTYDSHSNLTQEQGPTGCITQYDYDANHRLTSITDPEGFETTYAYDANGLVIARSVASNLGVYSFYYDGDGNFVNDYTDPLGRTWLHLSKDGYPVADIDPLGNTTNYIYSDGRMVAQVNPLGYATSYVYDDAGQLLVSIDPLGNRTSLTRDASENVIASKNPLGYITTYGFGSNPALRLMRFMMNPLGNVWTYNYADDGTPISAEDPLGNIATNVWNALGQQIAAINPLGFITTFEYDAVGNQGV